MCVRFSRRLPSFRRILNAIRSVRRAREAVRFACQRPRSSLSFASWRSKTFPPHRQPRHPLRASLLVAPPAVWTVLLRHWKPLVLRVARVSFGSPVVRPLSFLSSPSINQRGGHVFWSPTPTGKPRRYPSRSAPVRKICFHHLRGQVFRVASAKTRRMQPVKAENRA